MSARKTLSILRGGVNGVTGRVSKNFFPEALSTN